MNMGLGGSQITTQYTLPASQTRQTGGQRPKGARRLTNHALVTFVKDGDAWKIRDIELIEENRLL